MALRQSKLCDTWPIEDHSVWDHERMLQWICSLNPKFYQRYYNSFTIAKVNGVDFQLLTDTDYLFFVLSMNDNDSTSFSTVLSDRIYNYNISKHSQSQHVQKQPSEATVFATQPQNSLSPKQEYQFLTNGNRAIYVEQSSSSTLADHDVNGAVIIDYATKTKTKPKTQLQPPQNDMNEPNYFSDGTGPELPPSKSMLLTAAENEQNKQNIDSDSDSDDVYIEPLEPLDIKTPVITGPKFSTYDTPTGHNNLIPDSDDDDLYNVYQTKGAIHVNQSSSSTLTGMNGAAIDYAEKHQLQRNSLAELHQNSGGIAQLLICDDDNDFKQFDIQMDECQKLWDKHRELDANIQMQWSVTYDNNRSVTLQCLKKLERLLTVIGGPAAVTAFFNINAEISQTVLQTLILSVHTKKNEYEYEIFDKLKRTPHVTQKHTQTQQQMDYNMMVSVDFDIEYVVIIQNENQYKQMLINELAVVLGIHSSFIEILSSLIGVGGCWHLDIEVVMWPYLYSLKGISNDNSNCRRRDILQYKFEIGDRIDVKKKKKWYICKIKAVTIDDKLQQEKGKNIRIGYIGKYVDRNGERMKEMGKPFKLKNTEWIWTIADKKRIRVKQLNVAESMMDNFLKIAFKANQDRAVSRHSRTHSFHV